MITLTLIYNKVGNRVILMATWVDPVYLGLLLLGCLLLNVHDIGTCWPVGC